MFDAVLVCRYGTELRERDPQAFEQMRLVVGYYDLPQVGLGAEGFGDRHRASTGCGRGVRTGKGCAQWHSTCVRVGDSALQLQDSIVAAPNAASLSVTCAHACCCFCFAAAVWYCLQNLNKKRPAPPTHVTINNIQVGAHSVLWGRAYAIKAGCAPHAGA